MFEFPSNPFSADAFGRAFILAVVGWALVWRWLSKNAPDVANTTKKVVAHKAIYLLGRLFK